MFVPSPQHSLSSHGIAQINFVHNPKFTIVIGLCGSPSLSLRATSNELGKLGTFVNILNSRLQRHLSLSIPHCYDGQPLPPPCSLPIRGPEALPLRSRTNRCQLPPHCSGFRHSSRRAPPRYYQSQKPSCATHSHRDARLLLSSPGYFENQPAARRGSSSATRDFQETRLPNKASSTHVESTRRFNSG